jgi:hypothetical protein
MCTVKCGDEFDKEQNFYGNQTDERSNPFRETAQA